MRFELYRAVPDLLPSLNSPTFVGTGIFGKGTYFRPIYRPNTNFGERGECRHFLTISKFTVECQNYLTLDSKNTEGLEDSIELKFIPTGKKFDAEKTARYFDDFDMLNFSEEDTDGGKQLLLLPKKNLEFKNINFSIVSANKPLIKKISELSKKPLTKTELGHFQVKDISPKITKSVELILKNFIESQNRKIA